MWPADLRCQPPDRRLLSAASRGQVRQDPLRAQVLDDVRSVRALTNTGSMPFTKESASEHGRKGIKNKKLSAATRKAYEYAAAAAEKKAPRQPVLGRNCDI